MAITIVDSLEQWPRFLGSRFGEWDQRQSLGDVLSHLYPDDVGGLSGDPRAFFGGNETTFVVEVHGQVGLFTEVETGLLPPGVRSESLGEPLAPKAFERLCAEWAHRTAALQEKFPYSKFLLGHGRVAVEGQVVFGAFTPLSHDRDWKFTSPYGDIDSISELDNEIFQLAQQDLAHIDAEQRAVSAVKDLVAGALKAVAVEVEGIRYVEKHGVVVDSASPDGYGVYVRLADGTASWMDDVGLESDAVAIATAMGANLGVPVSNRFQEAQVMRKNFSITGDGRIPDRAALWEALIKAAGKVDLDGSPVEPVTRGRLFRNNRATKFDPDLYFVAWSIDDDGNAVGYSMDATGRLHHLIDDIVLKADGDATLPAKTLQELGWSLGNHVLREPSIVIHHEPSTGAVNVRFADELVEKRAQLWSVLGHADLEALHAAQGERGAKQFELWRNLPNDPISRMRMLHDWSDISNRYGVVVVVCRGPGQFEAFDPCDEDSIKALYAGASGDTTVVHGAAELLSETSAMKGAGRVAVRDFLRAYYPERLHVETARAFSAPSGDTIVQRLDVHGNASHTYYIKRRADDDEEDSRTVTFAIDPDVLHLDALEELPIAQLGEWELEHFCIAFSGEPGSTVPDAFFLQSQDEAQRIVSGEQVVVLPARPYSEAARRAGEAFEYRVGQAADTASAPCPE